MVEVRDNFHWVVAPSQNSLFPVWLIEFPRFFFNSSVFLAVCGKVKVERLISDFQSGALFSEHRSDYFCQQDFSSQQPQKCHTSLFWLLLEILVDFCCNIGSCLFFFFYALDFSSNSRISFINHGTAPAKAVIFLFCIEWWYKFSFPRSAQHIHWSSSLFIWAPNWRP